MKLSLILMTSSTVRYRTRFTYISASFSNALPYCS
jgi:hypothetical protein